MKLVVTQIRSAREIARIARKADRKAKKQQRPQLKFDNLMADLIPFG